MIDNTIIVEIDFPNEIDVDLGEAKFITAPARKVPQATPEIHISESGLITASATQEEGMVLAGTKSAELQMPTKSGAIIEPSKETQVAISKGEYALGDISVNPISDEYIKPSGTLEITQNNKEYDVANFKKANVNVAFVNKLPQVIDRSVTEITAEDLEGATQIGYEAFDECKSLKSVVIPKGVIKIDYRAFGTCESLETILLPDGLLRIENYAFTGCKSLKSIVIPETVLYWSDNLFNGCSSLVSVNIPSGVSSIFSQCFRSCASLANIVIPENITSIGSYAFTGCTSLTSVTIPDSVTSIGSSAFNNCYGLETVRLSNNITAIDTYIFQNCRKLTDITIPDSVTKINSYAFDGCWVLPQITIPSGVTTIASYAFNNCKVLKEVTVLATTPPTIQSSTFNKVPADCAFYVPAQSVEAYKTATNWSARADYIFAIEE